MSGLVWFPDDAWKVLEDNFNSGVGTAFYKELYICFGMCAVIAGLRFLLEKTIFKYVATKCLVGRPQAIWDNATDEMRKFFEMEEAKCNPEVVESFAKKCKIAVGELSEKKKEFTEAIKLEKNPTKFIETLWRVLMYSFLCCFEWNHIVRQDWAYSLELCWEGFPHIIQSTYLNYFNLMISQFFDVKRSDFIAMFIHHICTIVLLAGSYSYNWLKLGSLIVALHDVSDVFLEIAKIAKYIGYQFLADVNFVGFASSWFFLRLLYFPYFAIYKGSMTYGWAVAPCYALALLITFVWVLWVLHVYWFKFIVVVIYKKLVHGVEVDDEREVEEEEKEKLKKKSS